VILVAADFPVCRRMAEPSVEGAKVCGETQPLLGQQRECSPAIDYLEWPNEPGGGKPESLPPEGSRVMEMKERENVVQADAGQEEVERLRDELGRERDMRLRTLADFDNFRKRVEREREGAAMTGKRDIVLALLEVMDDFDRALAHAEESPESIVKGMRAVRKRLAGVLEAQGVTPFESAGQQFDPTLHEAIGTVESDEGESGAVLDELSRGYRWGEKLLRPARVRVAR